MILGRCLLRQTPHIFYFILYTETNTQHGKKYGINPDTRSAHTGSQQGGGGAAELSEFSEDIKKGFCGIVGGL